MKALSGYYRLFQGNGSLAAHCHGRKTEDVANNGIKSRRGFKCVCVWTAKVGKSMCSDRNASMYMRTRTKKCAKCFCLPSTPTSFFFFWLTNGKTGAVGDVCKGRGVCDLIETRAIYFNTTPVTREPASRQRNATVGRRAIRGIWKLVNRRRGPHGNPGCWPLRWSEELGVQQGLGF